MTEAVFHPDEPDLLDLVCHKNDVQQVGDLVRGGRPPFVVVVNGDWGSGKTSFLKKLHLYLAHQESGIDNADQLAKDLWSEIAEESCVETIWFDAWRAIRTKLNRSWRCCRKSDRILRGNKNYLEKARSCFSRP